MRFKSDAGEFAGSFKLNKNTISRNPTGNRLTQGFRQTVRPARLGGSSGECLKDQLAP
jgi:hypothetical protein